MTERTLRVCWGTVVCGLLCAGGLAVGDARAAEARSRNFVVRAQSQDVADKVARLAEHYRKELAIEWLGKPMPNWYKPCTVDVKIGRMGSGGATTFNFDRGEVFGWRMEIQGSLERVLDSVLPHEVNHTIFASHFRRPLPRWADEGAATLTENECEINRQRLLLGEVMRSGERFPMKELLAMREYPKGGQRRVLTMYAQGWSLADYLVQKGGKAKFLAFIEAAHRRGWDRAIEEFYGIKGVDPLEKTWSGWVMAGMPPVNPDGTMLADADTGSAPAGLPKGTVVRGQSPDDDEPRDPPAAADPTPRPLTLREVVASEPGWTRTAVRQPRPEPLGSYRTPIRR